MAISPNTDFTTGAVFTADQANRFPRGVMALTESIGSPSNFSTEAVVLTGSSFTAVANRYYKVTYFEPDIYSVSTTSYVAARIRATNISGAIKNLSYVQLPTVGTNVCMNLVWVGTLTAGTTNFVATLAANSGTSGAARDANTKAYLLVEDIGPA